MIKRELLEKYSVDYFIEKFKKISDSHWCSVEILSGDDEKSDCVGHCGFRDHMKMGDCKEADALFIIFMSHGVKPYWIDDGVVEQYQQERQKERILSALYDIKDGKSIEYTFHRPNNIEIHQKPCNMLIQVDTMKEFNEFYS